MHTIYIEIILKLMGFFNIQISNTHAEIRKLQFICLQLRKYLTPSVNCKDKIFLFTIKRQSTFSTLALLILFTNICTRRC